MAEVSELVLGLLGKLLSHSYVLVVVLVVTLLVYGLLPVLRSALRQQMAFLPVPTDPDQHFLFGHSPRLVRDMGAALDWFSSLNSKRGWKMTRVVMGPMWSQLVCLHPDTVKVILKSDPKSDLIYGTLKPWLGEGLLIANGARWARSRHLLTSAFHFDILRPYAHVFADSANVLVNIWSQVPEGQSFDVFPNISLMTLDVMLRCTCSYHSNCQTNKTHDPYINAVYDLSVLAVERIFFFPALFDVVYALTPGGWKNRRACRIVHQFSRDVIQKRQKTLSEIKQRGEDVLKGSKKKYLDFIDILLEARDEDGCGLTHEEIRAEVDTFMFEGHDTTASGIVWALYNLAKYPEHQEKCRQEVDAILDQKDAMEWEDLKQLTHMKYCIKESLRLFPPVSAHGRQLAQETEIGGHVFPPGTRMVITPYTVHRCPDIWDNPEEFDPLRFTPENSKGRHPYAFIPFSAGSRNCIGQEFAMNEIKVALSCILRRFELSLDTDKLPTKDFQLILRPKSGLYLKLKHRQL